MTPDTPANLLVGSGARQAGKLPPSPMVFGKVVNLSFVRIIVLEVCQDSKRKLMQSAHLRVWQSKEQICVKSLCCRLRRLSRNPASPDLSRRRFAGRRVICLGVGWPSSQDSEPSPCSAVGASAWPRSSIKSEIFTVTLEQVGLP